MRTALASNINQNKSKKNYFLLGSSGFIGKKLTKQISLCGDDIYLLDARKETHEYANQFSSLSSRNNEDDICIIAAAAGVNAKGFSDDDFRFNSEELPKKVEFLYKLGISKFIFLGSCFEYGLSGNTSLELKPESELVPKEPYGSSKKEGYLRLMSWAESKDISFSYLRLFQIFGNGEASHRLYSGLINAVKNGQDYLLKDPFAIRDFCHVDSVVEAVYSHSFDLSGIKTLNVCSGVPTNLLGFSRYILDSAQSKSKLLISDPPEEGLYRSLVGMPDIKLPGLNEILISNISRNSDI